MVLVKFIKAQGLRPMSVGLIHFLFEVSGCLVDA